MDPPGFEGVLSAARVGEGWALTELYRSLYPRILGYVAAVEPVEAEDVASETWLSIARGLERFRGDEAGLRALAFTIARRRILDLRRTRIRRRTEPGDPSLLQRAGETGNVEDEAIASLGTDWAVGLIVSTLPADQAEILLLRVIGSLDAAAVGKIVGKRPGTVRVLQHRALRRLARTLERQGVTP
jgi:RNA polymerase sigma-70 factor (ECF subfamily)